jgi:hypothetical protein
MSSLPTASPRCACPSCPHLPKIGTGAPVASFLAPVIARCALVYLPKLLWCPIVRWSSPCSYSTFAVAVRGELHFSTFFPSSPARESQPSSHNLGRGRPCRAPFSSSLSSANSTMAVAGTCTALRDWQSRPRYGAPATRLAAGEAWPGLAPPSPTESSPRHCPNRGRVWPLRAAAPGPCSAAGGHGARLSFLACASSPNRSLFFPSLCTVPRKKNRMCGYSREKEMDA